MSVPHTRLDALIERYDLFLFDAYGVLVHGTGVMPDAVDALRRLEAAGKPYYVVTNDASRLPASAAARYAALGLRLDASHLLTSGMLLEQHFAAHGLHGARCAVLGPPDGLRYVEIAGGTVVSPRQAFDVLVVCDESGFPFLETVDAALTSLIRMIDAGASPRLILPNPDLLYPDGVDAFGFAAGSVALMFEAALARRYPGRTGLRFTPLGKPQPHLYQEALARAGSGDAIMIGDQIETDIAGANAAGLDSALLACGVSLPELGGLDDAHRPTWLLSRLA